MTSEDRKAIDRFVAGLPVDADALATAIAGKALDRAVVIEALAKGLADEAAVVRRRTALRIGRMPELAPRLAARLTVLAGSDDDVRAREAGAAALRAHGLPAPGESDPARDRPEPTRGPVSRLAAQLLLRASVSRSGQRAPDGLALHGIELAARYRADAPQLDARLFEEADGVRVDLSGLPGEFAGTCPELRAALTPAPDPLTPVGRCEQPVSADGRVTIRVRLSGASHDDLAGWLLRGIDLVVAED